MSETLVLKGVQEGYLRAFLSPSLLPPLSILNSSLFRYANLFQSLLLFPDSRIHNHLFHPVRNDLIIPCFPPKVVITRGNQEESAVDSKEPPSFPYRLVPTSFRRGRFRFQKKSIRLAGGVIGSDRILSALGENGFYIFRDAWLLPPIFPSAPAATAIASVFASIVDRNQLKVKIVSGLAVQSVFSHVSNIYIANESTDPDSGALFYDGQTDIEVLVKVDYEYNTSVSKARNVFGAVLKDSCSFLLQESRDWKLHKVLIPRKDESSFSGSDSKTNIKESAETSYNFHDFSDEEMRPRLLCMKNTLKSEFTLLNSFNFG